LDRSGTLLGSLNDLRFLSPVSVEPTKDDRAKFRFLLNQHTFTGPAVRNGRSWLYQ
jgi:hypothetical protein